MYKDVLYQLDHKQRFLNFDEWGHLPKKLIFYVYLGWTLGGGPFSIVEYLWKLNHTECWNS